MITIQSVREAFKNRLKGNGVDLLADGELQAHRRTFGTVEFDADQFSMTVSPKDGPPKTFELNKPGSHEEAWDFIMRLKDEAAE